MTSYGLYKNRQILVLAKCFVKTEGLDEWADTSALNIEIFGLKSSRLPIWKASAPKAFRTARGDAHHALRYRSKV